MDKPFFLSSRAPGTAILFPIYVADVITTEAMVMRDGLTLANTLGFNRVKAEFNSINDILYLANKMVG